MNFDLKLTKKDVITMVLLATVFFSIATWNVGEVKAPVTNWQNTSQQLFYVNLGSSQQVQKVYFWVQSGNASVDVSSGAPGNWTYVRSQSLQSRATDYMVQVETPVNVNTQYLEFNVTAQVYDSRPDFYWSVPNPSDKLPSPFIEISEIGVSDPNNKQIPIVKVTGENGTDATLPKLVDEQTSLQIPPDYMSKMYFDEVYFARSAVEFVNHQIPDERTHPDLGKLIQAIGVAALGATPFAWRIMGVIFGTLIVVVMYLLGKKLFGTWIGGFTAAFLMTFDFMHFTMARIGTADTYLVFFTVASQLFFLIYFMKVLKDGWKKTSVLPLMLAIVFFALGFSTKFGFPLFSALGLLALLAAVRIKDLWKQKGSLADKYVGFFDHPFLLIIASIGLVALIYFAVYIPDMLLGDSFPKIVNLQFSMLSFHGGSVVDPSSSPWWSWPLMFGTSNGVPRWFDITYFPPNSNPVSTITVFGNPAVWWVGFASMIVLTAIAFHVEEIATNLWSRISTNGRKLFAYARISFGKLKHFHKGSSSTRQLPNSFARKHISIKAKGWDIPAIFIVVVFFFCWLPYVFVGRAAYIYHFYSSVPMLCLATAYFVNRYWNTRLGKVAAIALFAAVVAVFVLFYPVISGAPVDPKFVDNYLKWLPGWYFAP